MSLRHGNLTPEMAKASAKWWADRLRKRSKLDNGDKSINGFMAMGLASSLQKTMAEERTPEMIDRFEELLYERFLTFDYFAIGCDYGAPQIFHDCANEAGFNLSMSCLPWKTMMMFYTDESVKVAYGYGAPYKQIYPIDHSEEKKDVK